MGRGWGTGRRARTPISNWENMLQSPSYKYMSLCSFGVIWVSNTLGNGLYSLLFFHIILYRYFTVWFEPCLKLFTYNPREAAHPIFLLRPISCSRHGNFCNFSSRGLPTSVLPTLAGPSPFLSIRIPFHCPCPSTHPHVFLSFNVASFRRLILTQVHVFFASLLCVLRVPSTHSTLGGWGVS